MGQDDIRIFQHLNKYARFLPEKARRETWQESVDDRIMTFFLDKYGSKIDADVWADIRNALLADDACFAMRVVQMAGPAMVRCNVSAYNCAYSPIESLDDMVDALYILMQGTGFAYSVERKYIGSLPPVGYQDLASERVNFHVFTVPDTTEGWCDALMYTLRGVFSGRYVLMDYSQIRPAGTRLETKGGYASGHEPLQELIGFIWDIASTAQGRRFTPFEVHRIMCKIGKIVEVGGVRRAAMLCLSDLDDIEMRKAKNGEFWDKYPELTMANNSAVYTNLEAQYGDFLDEWDNLVSSGTGERGIFNRSGNMPSRRALADFGTNPCGEIILRPRQFCNLSIAVIRPSDSRDEITRKVTLAAIMGTLQAGLTDFKYISNRWKGNCREEALLGVDLLGAVDNLYLHDPSFLATLRDLVVATNKEYAAKIGIKQAAATTCIKPGGNSSERFGTGNSITGWHGKYIKRRVRVNDIDPMCKFLKDQGLEHEPAIGSDNVTVFTFLKEAPEGAVLRSSMDAKAQLEYWLLLKKNWTEHNPSTTIFVKEDEWGFVREWLETNWEYVGGLAFLPYSDAVYLQQPNEEVSQEVYNDLVSKFPTIDWALFGEYEKMFGDTTTVGQEMACLGGACDL